MKKTSIGIKRQLRTRRKLKSVNTNRFRISVSKSLNNLSAQIIDDKLKKTLVSASSIEKEINQNYSEKKRIEEEHRIVELKLLEAKKSLEQDNELLANENIRLKNELQVRGKLNKNNPDTKTVKKKRKGNKSKRKRGK